MKLKKITLSGFKSFVDPTSIHLQSNLTGVVGPNGCGKSNIIDAIRWVMGEISAKQLRGESMSDVIFNGSSTRKPVGKAAVELVFDNSDACFGGEFAKYKEISIRREVTRDGFSDYFLNNTVCRRKDITNVFLGTGLGPNSYAIIEQGMISQFIDAKPDELRVVIEEAAGISKYKERRRETENRIKHTKENLSRLNDILEELNKQLKHLKSQANAAERYRKLKQGERLAKAELHVLHFREIDKKLKALEEAIKSEEELLENKTTELHVLNAENAKLKEHHAVDSENFNIAQEKFYKVGGNIGRIEQQIQHTKERKEQLSADLEHATKTWQETIGQQTTDKDQIDLFRTEKENLETGIHEKQVLVENSLNELQQTEQKMHQWQNDWDEFNTNNAKILQEVEVGQARVKHLEQRIERENQLLEKFKGELSELDFITLNTEVEKLNNLFQNLKNDRDKLHTDVIAKQQQIADQRGLINKVSKNLDQKRNELQTLVGRKSSLEVLQQAALGKNDEVLNGWLKHNNLEQKPRLAEKIKAVSGWENALETVLGDYLEAVCVDGIPNIAGAVKNLNHGSLSLLASIAPVTTQSVHAETLASKVTSEFGFGGLLKGIYVADTLDQALAIQPKLDPHESIITKDGVWLGEGWLRVAYKTNQKIGVLQRERELQDLDLMIRQKQEVCSQEEQELEQLRNVLAKLEHEYQIIQQQLHTLTAEYSDAQSQATAKQTYLQHLDERAKVIKQEIGIHEVNLNNEKENLNVALKQVEELITQKNLNEQQRQILIQNKEQIQNQLNFARENAQKLKQDLADVTNKIQLIETQIGYLKQNLERADKRLLSLKEQQEIIEKSLSQIDEPLANLEKELQGELEKRLVAETELSAAKQKIGDIEEGLRQLEQKCAKQQEANEKIRLSLEKLRTERQGLHVRSTTYNEQIAELDFKIEEVNANLPETAAIDEWEEKLNRLSTKIDRLGLINLAAIEEYEKLLERKNYLEGQNQDLVDALNTLEEAIRKIDHDTKERFKEAYANINNKFQELFPKIFNGGKAQLEQTENNLLETGVMIMAQPPGKRNSSIHLLSGGEKALTAIALIFSIFHLNPAPFCMLDEVDAPLDDVNISRYCNLVTEMSKAIQFIFVTHNKLTMEISQQLLGITMQEAGVSRMVAVDIDTAVSMAGAG